MDLWAPSAPPFIVIDELLYYWLIVSSIYTLPVFLSAWIFEMELPRPEQICLCKGASTVDHCVALTHLVGKNIRCHKTKTLCGLLGPESIL